MTEAQKRMLRVALRETDRIRARKTAERSAQNPKHAPAMPERERSRKD